MSKALNYFTACLGTLEKVNQTPRISGGDTSRPDDALVTAKLFFEGDSFGVRYFANGEVAAHPVDLEVFWMDMTAVKKVPPLEGAGAGNPASATTHTATATKRRARAANVPDSSSSNCGFPTATA